jgi:hypothetical protein
MRNFIQSKFTVPQNAFRTPKLAPEGKSHKDHPILIFLWCKSSVRPSGINPYDLGHGAPTGYSDVEIATAAYHVKHLSAKMQAGFRIYASGFDRATLTERIEGDYNMMQGILDL